MSDIKNGRDIKIGFIVLIDGVMDFPPKYKGIDSLKLGICDLIFKDNILHIYLRRPGLLIGKGGELINKIIKDLGIDIKVHNVNLYDSYAQELLEALEDMVSLFPEPPHDDRSGRIGFGDDLISKYNKSVAAIKKAYGETK